MFEWFSQTERVMSLKKGTHELFEAFKHHETFAWVVYESRLGHCQDLGWSTWIYHLCSMNQSLLLTMKPDMEFKVMRCAIKHSYNSERNCSCSNSVVKRSTIITSV